MANHLSGQRVAIWSLTIIVVILFTVIIYAPGGVYIAKDPGSAADWVAAIGGLISAGATIVIGRYAYQLTAEVERARRAEETAKSDRESADAASAKADRSAQRRREWRTNVAKFRGLRNSALRAKAAPQLMDGFREWTAELDAMRGREGEPDQAALDRIDYLVRMTSISRVRMGLRLLQRKMAAITWSEDAKSLLSAKGVDAVTRLEDAVLVFTLNAEEFMRLTEGDEELHTQEVGEPLEWLISPADDVRRAADVVVEMIGRQVRRPSS